MPQPARRYIAPLALLLLGCAGTYYLRYGRAGGEAVDLDLKALPLDLAGFEGQELPPDDSVFAYLGADQMIDRVYVSQDGDVAVKLTIVFAHGWRALHSPRECYRNQGWGIVEEGHIDISAASGGSYSGTLLVMRKPERRIATVYTFVTGPKSTGSWLRHSLRMAAQGQGRGGALIAAISPTAEGEMEQEATDAARLLVGEAATYLKNASEGAG